MSSEIVVAVDDERRLITAILDAVGASPQESAITSDALVEADLRGQTSHGLLRLPRIVERVRGGLTRVNAAPVITWHAAALGSMDAQQALGHPTALRAAEAAAERARQAGCAVLTVRNNNHIGMLAYYVEALAERGFVALMMTTSEALVHPTGGRESLIGTNPIAVGFPSTGSPFVLDMSTSATAMGRVIDFDERGKAIPLDWVVDADGAPTSDPAVARHGSINPFGGAKGYGLGLAVELFAGALANSAVGRGVVGTLDSEHLATKGDVVIVLDPSALPGARTLAHRVGTYLQEIRSSAPIDSGEPVRVPGDASRAVRKARLEAGIPIGSKTWSAIVAIAGELAVELPR